VTRAAALSLLFVFALGCGKYGAPVRAAEVQPEKPPPKLELPVPVPGAEPPAEAPAPDAPAPPPEPSAEPEQEPPLEGAP
jgi:hypothetical protein